ncbi:MAG: hypothetical protein AMXMBFR4_21300 [Candidatus Hydrogenedentota bacterium]
MSKRPLKLRRREVQTLGVLILAALASLSGCGQSIHDAALKGDIQTVRRMLEADPSLIHARTPLEKTPLHQAITSGNDELIQFLIERGADVNARDKTGLTPLHVAAWWMATRRARQLLDLGADIHAVDVFGDTPLHTAAMHDRAAMCRFLIEQGADPDARNREGLRPIDLAIKHRAGKAAEVLTILTGLRGTDGRT